MSNPFRYFNSSPEVIRLVVMMYVRYPLSLRNVEDLLAERGIDISHETVRFWWNRFGPMFAGEIRKRAEPEGPVLSPREREVLKLIAGGNSIPAMAKELYLAPSTVKTHVQRLYEKLGVGDRGAAVAEAMRRKLLE